MRTETKLVLGIITTAAGAALFVLAVALVFATSDAQTLPQHELDQLRQVYGPKNAERPIPTPPRFAIVHTEVTSGTSRVFLVKDTQTSTCMMVFYAWNYTAPNSPVMTSQLVRCE